MRKHKARNLDAFYWCIVPHMLDDIRKKVGTVRITISARGKMYQVKTAYNDLRGSDLLKLIAKMHTLTTPPPPLKKQATS